MTGTDASATVRRALGSVARAPRRVLNGSRLDVRSAALRVAVIATAFVCVAYLIIAAAVMLIVNRNLTTDIDGRLQARLSLYVNELSGPPMGPNGFSGPTQHSLQAPLLTWVIFPSGVVQAYVDNDTQFRPQGALPVSARSIASSTTFSLSDGTGIRGAGVDVAGVHIVVGQSLANVEATQHNILTAELLIGPLLLIAVFLGAFTIGRRVGSPIERARQRQIEMTADASHELRTPLSVIEAQTSLALERDRDRDTQWYRNAFQAVGVESKRMRRLVDDLLWLARFDSAGPPPSSEATDLGVLAEQAADRFKAVAEARGLTLSVEVEPVSTMISAPPEWLDRLLGVLLDNACRYTPSGGWVDVRVGRRDGRVRLAVDDSGAGIPPEERSRIFDRFRRASDAPGGSGLGLAIADAVVGASGGRWEVGASPAGGASMAVSWTSLIRGGAEAEGSVRNSMAPAATDPSPSAGAALAPHPPQHPA